MPGKRAAEEVQAILGGDAQAAKTPSGMATPDAGGLLWVERREQGLLRIPDHEDYMGQTMLVCPSCKK